MMLNAQFSFFSQFKQPIEYLNELLFDIDAAIAALFLLLVFIYFPDKPLKPPSNTAAMERTERKLGPKPKRHIRVRSGLLVRVQMQDVA